MSNSPAEVVFPISGPETPLIVPWRNGPVKIKEPSRKGRPVKRQQTGHSSKHDGHITETGNRFQFIHHSEASSSARLTIRRHAMIDTVRRKRKRKLNQKVVERKPLVSNPQASSVRSATLVLSEIIKVDPFNAFPFELEPYMHDLLGFYITSIYEKLYPIEKYTGYNPLTAHWLPLAFSNAALLHVILACSDSFIAESWNPRIRPIAIKHLNAAICVVNENISAQPLVVSDETIVVVSTMAIIEKTTGYHDHWKIHMKGLQKLVKIRGGLGALKPKPLLLSKIHQADLCGSAEAVETPYFPSTSDWDSSYPPGLPTSIVSFKCSRLNDLDRIVSFDEEMRCIISRLEAAIISLNCLHDGNTGIDPTSLRASLESIQYALLSNLKNNANGPNELFRMGLVLFLITIFNQLPQWHVLGSGKLLVGTRRLLEENFCSASAEEAPAVLVELRLWIMFLAAAAISDDSSLLKKWYMSVIAATTSSLLQTHDHDWDDVKPRVVSFFWVPNLQEHAFAEVWRKTRRVNYTA